MHHFATFLKLKVEPADLRNAGIIALSCGIAILLNFVWHSPQALWAVIMAFFLPYAKTGRTANARHLSLLFMGCAAVLLVTITSILPTTLGFMLPWLFISTIILYTLPRYLAGTQLVGIFLLVFIVLAHNLPIHSTQDIYLRIASILTGTLIVVLMDVIFDHQTRHIANIMPDKSLHLVQRAIRMALAISFVMFICHDLHIKNSAWVAASLIVIDQTTLGATIKKAGKRMLGTIFGLALGVVLAHYVFHPYPITQLAILALIFVFYAVLRYHYTLAISIGTVLLCNLFYVLYSQQITFLEFIQSRLGDTLLGISIGLVSSAVIFPQSLYQPMRLGFFNFWRSVELLVNDGAHKQPNKHSLNELQAIVYKLDQDIKDFRYEPTSLLFRRYHLCVKIVRLMQRLSTALTRLPDINQSLTTDNFQLLIIQPITQSMQLLTRIYNNPNCKDTQPLKTMQQQLSAAISQLAGNTTGKKLLITLKSILRCYERMLTTPRWRLELS